MINVASQYIRIGANILMSLISTRLVIDALGSVDYGIYTLVAGVVSLLSFISNTLTTTTQRYLSFNESRGDITILRSYFANSLAVQLSLGLFMIVVFSLLASFLFSNFLNISPDRINASKIVYYIVVLMLFLSLITSSYRAVLITHENIVYLSIVDVLDGIFKLLIGYSLYCFDSSRLVWYALLTSGIALFNLLAVSVYGSVKYDECKHLSISLLSKEKIKELTSFAGWTGYGTLCLFGRVQGLSIVLNKFFGTIVNAAYGISLTINAALQSISAALQTALSPQLVKAEGDNQRGHMMKISEMGCKINFILMSCIGIPLIFNIDNILSLWLRDVPPYTSLFCVILVASNLVDQLSVGFGMAINAIGTIAGYHLKVNTLKLLTVVFVALLLYFKVELMISFGMYFVIEAISSFIRVRQCFKLANVSIEIFMKNVVLKLLPTTLFIIVAYWLSSHLDFSVMMLISEIIVISILYFLSVYALSLNSSERNIVKGLITRILHRH